MSKLLVEDFESLDGLSYEKLRKLLDVAKDYRIESQKSFEDADKRVRDILTALDILYAEYNIRSMISKPTWRDIDVW